MKRFVSLFLLTFSYPSYGEAIPATELETVLLHSGFIEAKQPKDHQGPLYRIEQKNGELHINQTECPKKPEQIEFKGRHIKYVGTDHGEFGGELTAQFPNGTTKILLNKQVKAILPNKTHTKLWVFTGLAHMGFSNGDVYTIENFETVPILKHITMLPDAPIGVFKGRDIDGENEILYIMGFRSLCCLSAMIC